MKKKEIFDSITEHCLVNIKEAEIYKKKHNDYYSGQIVMCNKIIAFINILAIGELN